MIHASCCAVHNEPALPIGPCDCGLDLALDAVPHSGIAALVLWARGHGFLIEDVCREYLVETHQLPANALVADAAASNLPDSHNPVPFLSAPDRMNFDDA